MGVDVDEARGHDAPVGVELPVTRGVDHRVHGDHAVADHTYISLSGRSPCAVDDGSIANDQIHVHKPSPCSGMAYPSVSTHPVPRHPMTAFVTEVTPRARPSGIGRAP